MKIIDGTNAILGRLASYVAKEALKGEEFVILNCEKIIISGNKKNIQEKLLRKRKMIGSSQKGPKYLRTIDKIVKTAIRGMLPNYREGRGREAFKKIKCYIGVPKEFEKEKMIKFDKEKVNKFVKIGEISK